MIQQMQHIDFAGKTVLDFGTGTGILAILAEKLGASKVLAIDNDEWSITNAIENIEQNHCNKIIIEQHNTIPFVQKFDIILANINLNVITANLISIASICEEGGNLLFSGFLKSNEVVMQDSIKKVDFQYIETVQSAEWIAIRTIKN
jgi:ribosomal protein L11 methyltransferase